MRKHSIRRVPIVKECANGKQKCLGIIILDDLIKVGKLMLSQIQKKFSIKPAEAAALLQSFWRSLAQTVSLGEIRKIERELPKDITLLLSPKTLP